MQTRVDSPNRVKCFCNFFCHDRERKSSEIVLEGPVRAGLGGPPFCACWPFWPCGTATTCVGLPGFGLLQIVAILAAFYLFYRFWTRWRSQVLWSLRNRLIVAYLFIAVVPIILLLIFSSLFGQIIYSQLGAYLLFHDVEDRLEMLRNSAEAIAAAESTLPATMDQLDDGTRAGRAEC